MNPRLNIPLVCVAMALGTASLLSHARAEVPGMMMDDAGIHFLTPYGFELTRTELMSPLGPARMIILEPQDGRFLDQPNSAFIAFTVYQGDVVPQDALHLVEAQLRETFTDRPGLTSTPETTELCGSAREGLRLDFQLLEVALVGHVAAMSQDGVTLLAYVQGRPVELEALAEVIRTVFGSVGVGPATPPETQPNP